MKIDCILDKLECLTRSTQTKSVFLMCSCPIVGFLGGAMAAPNDDKERGANPVNATEQMAKIVIIDDDQMVLETISRLLERDGHTVIPYLDGRHAIEQIGNDRPDILITDIFMPNIDGLEVLRTIRRSDPNLPIIAMSGKGIFGPIDYLIAAERLGATAVLQKPLGIEKLAVLVPQLLGETNDSS